jgi:phosphatidylserine synthase 2
MFSMIQFRDGPFIRPHPAFWRAVLGTNLLYELALVFLLFQDLHSARRMMTLLDPSLNIPLPEKSYAESCELNPQNIWVSFMNFSLEMFELKHVSECHRYILPGTCIGMVWQSDDFT